MRWDVPCREWWLAGKIGIYVYLNYFCQLKTSFAVQVLEGEHGWPVVAPLLCSLRGPPGSTTSHNRQDLKLGSGFPSAQHAVAAGKGTGKIRLERIREWKRKWHKRLHREFVFADYKLSICDQKKELKSGHCNKAGFNNRE